MHREVDAGAFEGRVVTEGRNAGTNGFSYWARMGQRPEYDVTPLVREAAEVVENAYWDHWQR